MALVQFRFDYIEEGSMPNKELLHNILQAAHAGDLDEVKAAIREYPEAVNLRHEITKSTALHFAAACGNYSIVEFLLSCEGVDVWAKDGYGRTVLETASARGHTGIWDMLADAMNPRDRLGDFEGNLPGEPDFNQAERDWLDFEEAELEKHEVNYAEMAPDDPRLKEPPYDLPPRPNFRNGPS